MKLEPVLTDSLTISLVASVIALVYNLNPSVDTSTVLFTASRLAVDIFANAVPTPSIPVLRPFKLTFYTVFNTSDNFDSLLLDLSISLLLSLSDFPKLDETEFTPAICFSFLLSSELKLFK